MNKQEMNKQEKIDNFNPSGIGVNNGNFIGLPFDEADASVVLLPVPWDVTVSFTDGTATGAQNILDCSAQLDLYDVDVKNAWQLGIFMRPLDEDWLNASQQNRVFAKTYIDFLENGGNINDDTDMQLLRDKVNSACDELRTWVKSETTALMNQGKMVGLVGGDHSTPLGYLQALSERHGEFGILHFDAHQDLREAYEGFEYSHASIFYNALKIKEVKRLVQIGIRDNCQAEVDLVEQSGGKVAVFYDAYLKKEMYKKEASMHSIYLNAIEILPRKVYISFDIDSLNPSLCPNTGTPVPGGLEYHEALYIIKLLVDSGRQIIGFDLSEVAGIGHEWDGNVGARILYKLCNFMGRSNQLI